MSADIIQFIPRPDPMREERMRELERQRMEIINAAFPNVMTDCSQANAFHSPERDPA